MSLVLKLPERFFARTAVGDRLTVEMTELSSQNTEQAPPERALGVTQEGDAHNRIYSFEIKPEFLNYLEGQSPWLRIRIEGVRNVIHLALSADEIAEMMSGKRLHCDLTDAQKDAFFGLPTLGEIPPNDPVLSTENSEETGEFWAPLARLDMGGAPAELGFWTYDWVGTHDLIQLLRTEDGDTAKIVSEGEGLDGACTYVIAHRVSYADGAALHMPDDLKMRLSPVSVEPDEYLPMAGIWWRKCDGAEEKTLDLGGRSAPEFGNVAAVKFHVPEHRAEASPAPKQTPWKYGVVRFSGDTSSKEGDAKKAAFLFLLDHNVAYEDAVLRGEIKPLFGRGRATLQCPGARQDDMDNETSCLKISWAEICNHEHDRDAIKQDINVTATWLREGDPQNTSQRSFILRVAHRPAYGARLVMDFGASSHSLYWGKASAWQNMTPLQFDLRGWDARGIKTDPTPLVAAEYWSARRADLVAPKLVPNRIDVLKNRWDTRGGFAHRASFVANAGARSGLDRMDADIKSRFWGDLYDAAHPDGAARAAERRERAKEDMKRALRDLFNETMGQENKKMRLAAQAALFEEQAYPPQMVVTHPAAVALSQLKTYQSLVRDAYGAVLAHDGVGLVGGNKQAKLDLFESLRQPVLCLPEPLALVAAQCTPQGTERQRFVIIDMGRRTLDLAVVDAKVDKGDLTEFKLRDVSGYPFGGQTIDYFLMAGLAEKLEAEQGLSPADLAGVFPRCNRDLWKAAEASLDRFDVAGSPEERPYRNRHKARLFAQWKHDLCNGKTDVFLDLEGTFLAPYFYDVHSGARRKFKAVDFDGVKDTRAWNAVRAILGALVEQLVSWAQKADPNTAETTFDEAPVPVTVILAGQAMRLQMLVEDLDDAIAKHLPVGAKPHVLPRENSGSSDPWVRDLATKAAVARGAARLAQTPTVFDLEHRPVLFGMAWDDRARRIKCWPCPEDNQGAENTEGFSRMAVVPAGPGFEAMIAALDDIWQADAPLGEMGLEAILGGAGKRRSLIDLNGVGEVSWRWAGEDLVISGLPDHGVRRFQCPTWRSGDLNAKTALQERTQDETPPERALEDAMA